MGGFAQRFAAFHAPLSPTRPPVRGGSENPRAGLAPALSAPFGGNYSVPPPWPGSPKT